MSLLLLGTTELGKKLASNCDDTEEYLLFPTFFEQFTKVRDKMTKHPIGGNCQICQFSVINDPINSWKRHRSCCCNFQQLGSVLLIRMSCRIWENNLVSLLLIIIKILQ